jgi:hypothetical protein
MSQIFKQPPVLFATPDGPATAVVLADVNKDGNADAIVVDGNLNNPIFSIDGAVSVLLGNGNGTFQPAVTYPAILRGTDAVAVGDLNGDGWPDLVVVSNDGACLSFYCLGVLLNKGDGTFDAVVGYTTAGFDISSVVISDVNGDGKPDLVFADLCDTGCKNGAVEVLLGNGDGTFGSPTLYSLNRDSYPLSVVAVDLNGDGKSDLVVANCCTSTASGIVTVMLNKGDGTFPTQVTYPTGGNLASSVVAADMNHDGKLDLVVANLYSASVGVLLGNGDGTFGKVVVYPAIQDPDSIAIADFNGDGSPDVVVASGDDLSGINSNLPGNVTVLLNNGNGTLRAPVTTYSTKGTNANSVAVAKLNPDAKPDLVIADGCDGYKSDCPSGGVAVFLGMPDRTTTVLTSSANPSNPGQSVTFTATISATEGPIPNGTVVQFLSDTKKIGTGTTVNGVAKFSTSSLTAGTHLIKASYPSSTFFKASNSTLEQMVN